MDPTSNRLVLLTLYFPPKNKPPIESFVGVWNNHPLRTEHNWNPWQVWVNGILQQENVGNTAVREFFYQDPGNLYAIDPQGPPPNKYDLGINVEVPKTPCLC